MKKIFAIVLAFAMVLGMAACGKTEEPAVTTTPEPATQTETPAAPTTEPAAATEPETDAEEGVMSYADYAAADLDSEVTVVTYVQATQSWWDGTITAYTQDQDGAYFCYNMACTEEDAAKLVPGTKIKVTGYKSEWSGEIEIADATFEFVEDGDTFVAEAKDVTALLGTDELIDSQNQFVAFKGLTVEPSIDSTGAEVPFLYNWDGSGSEGNDLYFNVSYMGKVYNFTVESYLCGSGTDAYEGIKALNIGDTVDLEGFLYWYEGVNPHITAVSATPDTKTAGVMTYAEYEAAAIDDEVVVETYVQATQSWWDNTITVYSQDKDGAYFMYNMACTEADAAKLVPGTKIKVTGYKSEWSGEVEIVDAAFEIEEGCYVAPAADVTALLGTDELIAHQNEFVSFKGLTVASEPLYKWDGSGVDGDDLYFDVSNGTDTFTFTVESYLCGAGTDVYEGVKALKVGDTVNLEGFLYWYEGVNPHITSVEVL